MQEPICKLKEIIWEITSECYNGCEYCGSTDILNKCGTSEENIIKIAENICSYPPEEVNISGGDPIIISYETHKRITEMFKEKGITCKILVNPKSFHIMKDPESKFKILDLYDVIGLSVNTKEELELANIILPNLPETSKILSRKEKTTIITNFNLDNVWEFDEIALFCLNRNRPWQIQYTMGYKSLYEFPKANAYFIDRIKTFKSNQKYKNIIYLADNLNCGKCSAGQYSLGISHNGYVVPCLSMRAWSEVMNPKGNLLNESLESVWCEGFASWRTQSFKCCKDVTNCISIPWDTPTTILPEIKQDFKPQEDYPMTFVYGAINPKQTKLPFSNNMIMSYGVFSNCEVK